MIQASGLRVAPAGAEASPDPDSSFVYVIGSCRTMVKVGVADHPAFRLAQLQTGSPDDLSIFHAVPVPRTQAYAIERRAHDLLRKHHRRGEWFATEPDLALAAIHKARLAESLLRRPQLRRSCETDPVHYLIRRRRLGPYAVKALAEYRTEINGGPPARVRDLERFLRDECGDDQFSLFSSFAAGDVNMYAVLRDNPQQLLAAEEAVEKVLRKVISIAGWTSGSASHRFAT